MDSKSESEEMTYPFVCFTVDNFDEAFSDIQVGLLSKSNFDVVFQVRDGEMVAVELVARDTRGSMEAVLSLGCIQYDSTRSVVFLKLYFDDWLLETLVVCYVMKMLFASTFLLFEGYLWLVYSWCNCRVGWASSSPGGLWPSTVAWDVTLGAWSPTNICR